MSTTTIESQFTNSVLNEVAPAINVPDHDIAEIAIGFGRYNASRLHNTDTDFRSATIGPVTFRRVDPLREPLRVADVRLQQHLESLCETLRAKY